MRIRTVLMAILCLAAACRDDAPVAPSAPLSTLVGKGQVQLVIQQDRRLAGDSALFIVHVVANDVPLAAYQGEITFNAATFDVLAVRTPDPQDGEFRIVNGAAAASGRIQFAGFTPEGFTHTEALRIVARMRDGLAASDLDGTITVAGEVAGASMRPEQLRRSDGVRDARTNLKLLP